MKMNGKYLYFMLIIVSVVWFVVMIMIFGNLFLKILLYNFFNKIDFNYKINIWILKEYINEDLLS